MTPDGAQPQILPLDVFLLAFGEESKAGHVCRFADAHLEQIRRPTAIRMDEFGIHLGALAQVRHEFNELEVAERVEPAEEPGRLCQPLVLLLG